MSEALLVCQELSCGYRGRAVLTDLSFDLRSGEVIALLGPNGSGKSTLLKTICQELAPLGGQIRVLGEPLGKLSSAELARRVSVVPQEEAPVFAFSVRESVTLGRLARSHGLFDTDDDRRIADEAMAIADCLSLADRSVTEISGGEGQRVLIARAIAQDTPILLMDEPTSHLDPLHQISVSRLTRRLVGDGKGVIAAIHDLNLASEISDRAILLGPQGLLLIAPTQEVLHHSALEEAYQTSFERIEGSTGTIVRARF